MRTLRSKQSDKKKQKRNQFIIGAILIFVMFGSVFGIIANSFGEDTTNNKIVYNGLEFIEQNDFWFTTIGNTNFVFKHNPNEVPKINSSLDYFNKYSGQPLYIYSEDYLSETEIYRNFNQIVLRMQKACFEEECGEDLPIKTCEDNFIIIKEGNITKIVQEENCVFIEGEKKDLTKLTDEFLFKILSIEQ